MVIFAKNQGVGQEKDNVLSIPGYVISKNIIRGAKHGHSKRQRMYCKAKEMLHEARQPKHTCRTHLRQPHWASSWQVWFRFKCHSCRRRSAWVRSLPTNQHTLTQKSTNARKTIALWVFRKSSWNKHTQKQYKTKKLKSKKLSNTPSCNVLRNT